MRLKTLAVAALCCLAAAPSFGAAPRCGSGEERMSWKLMLVGFADTFSASKHEVDGSLDGRFFPKTMAFEFSHLEGGKHFIRLRCREMPASQCDNDRDEVEFRTVAVALLRLIGNTPDQSLLYDLQTWELQPLGRKKLEDLKKCHPDLWTVMADVVTGKLDPHKMSPH